MKIKKALLVLLGIFFTMGLVSAVSFADTGSKMDVKVGDKVYVCNCGEKCDCDAMSKKAGNCACDKPMVQTKVTKVENGNISVDGQKMTYKSVGKYACACGPACDCGTISQKAGKCACGKEMKEVK